MATPLMATAARRHVSVRRAINRTEKAVVSRSSNTTGAATASIVRPAAKSVTLEPAGIRSSVDARVGASVSGVTGRMGREVARSHDIHRTAAVTGAEKVWFRCIWSP